MPACMPQTPAMLGAHLAVLAVLGVLASWWFARGPRVVASAISIVWLLVVSALGYAALSLAPR